MKRTIDSAIILTLVTAFLYSASVAHFNGYLSALGIAPDFISRTTETILYYALIVVGFATIMGGFILMVFVTSVALISIYLLRFLNNFYIFKRFFVKLRGRANKKKSINSFVKLEEIFTRLIKYSTIIFILPFSLLLIMAFFEYQGKKDAQELLEKIRMGKLKEKIIVTNNNNEKLYIVTCGINNCVGINVDSKKIIYFEKKINDFSSDLKLE